MSLLEEELQAEADESKGAAATSPAALTAFRRGVSGVIVPIITTVIAFLAGGLIVLATGHNPLSTYTVDLQRDRPQLAVPVGHRLRACDRGRQPAADAYAGHIFDPRRPRGRVRVPRRHVQHRRPGPIHRRPDHRRLDRLLLRRDAAAPPHRVCDRRRSPRRRCVGRNRRCPEGGHGRQRGDLDDHARTGSRSGSASTASSSGARCRTRIWRRRPYPATSSPERSCRCSGAAPRSRGSTSGSSSRSRSRSCSPC